MPAKKPQGPKRSTKDEWLRRVGLVESWGGYLYLSADRERSGVERRSMHGLKLKGGLTDPVAGVSAFELTVCSDPRACASSGDVPAIGSWLKAKPALDGLVMLAEREFDLVLALAVGGKLASISVSFQKPHYGHGLITRVDFSSEVLVAYGMPGWVARFSVAYGKPYGLVVKAQAAAQGPWIESRAGNPCRSNAALGGR